MYYYTIKIQLIIIVVHDKISTYDYSCPRVGSSQVWIPPRLDPISASGSYWVRSSGSSFGLNQLGQKSREVITNEISPNPVQIWVDLRLREERGQEWHFSVRFVRQFGSIGFQTLNPLLTSC